MPVNVLSSYVGGYITWEWFCRKNFVENFLICYQIPACRKISQSAPVSPKREKCFSRLNWFSHWRTLRKLHQVIYLLTLWNSTITWWKLLENFMKLDENHSKCESLCESILQSFQRVNLREIRNTFALEKAGSMNSRQTGETSRSSVMSCRISNGKWAAQSIDTFSDFSMCSNWRVHAEMFFI